MPSSSGAPTRSLVLGPAITAVALLAFGCGGGDSDDARPPAATSVAAPPADEFPDPNGRTLEQIAAETPDSDLVVSPASAVFRQGANRLGMGVFSVDREPVNDAGLAIYAARPSEPATGPFPAAIHSLVTDPAFRSQSTANDPDAAESVYTTQIRFDQEGEWRLLALVKDDGGEPASTILPSVEVGMYPDVPREGDRAPSVSTPTAADVGGDMSRIDTRQPPSTMHDHDLAEVIGEQPVVLLFATAALCASRVCGPVIDITEQVKRDRPGDAAYIHMEIWQDNQVNAGPNRQVQAYGLPTEPWLFVIDEDGRISTAIEGAFGSDELEEALDRANG